MDAVRCGGGVSVSAWGVRNSKVFGTDNGRRTPVNLSWAASLSCRYCCKSPKLPGANFLAVKKSDRRRERFEYHGKNGGWLLLAGTRRHCRKQLGQALAIRVNHS